MRLAKDNEKAIAKRSPLPPTEILTSWSTRSKSTTTVLDGNGRVRVGRAGPSLGRVREAGRQHARVTRLDDGGAAITNDECGYECLKDDVDGEVKLDIYC